MNIPGKPSLNEVFRDFNIIRLNVKNFGYHLAREINPSPTNNELKITLEKVGLKSKLTTQKDIESHWVRYWCNQLKIEPIYHRKIWELCYVPQAIHEYGEFESDEPLGLGFGCGEEPLPSLFTSLGHKITVTDLEPEKVQGLGWAEIGQYTTGLDKVFYKDIVDKTTFYKNITLKYVDMNNIPPELERKYDYCWSVCSLEHLGSIRRGLNFIKNSLKTLKPGGIAVHTTEFNYTNEPKTIDNWPTVIFQKKHIEELSDELKNAGHWMADLDFNPGNGVLDRFVDIPPYSFGEGWLSKELWGKTNQNVHLKLGIDGFPCTCIGIIIRKK